MSVAPASSHSIAVEEVSRPIIQNAHQLGPEKGAEVGCQVESLQEWGFIVPADSAWSSPVVLVKKRMGHSEFV